MPNYVPDKVQRSTSTALLLTILRDTATQCSVLLLHCIEV
jgi:hypothetical protein